MQGGSSEELFPLDIGYGEISTWLADRRKLASDWMQRLREVQLRTAKAFAALPTAFAAQFDSLEDGAVEYPTAREIRDKLAETAERGYFGGLSGEAGAWDKIVRSYEKGNLYLGEAGQRILKNVDYEIPFLKKRMEALDKRTQELTRRRSECENNAATAASSFAKDCREMGIEGGDLRREIAALGDRVFDVLRKGMDDVQAQKTKTAVEFYRAVALELHRVEEAPLPVMQKVMDNAVDPPAVDLIKEIHLDDPTKTTAEEIDVTDVTGGIDFDINWDAVPEEAPPAEQSESLEVEWEDDGGINWEIEVEEVKAEEAPVTDALNERTSAAVDSPEDAVGIETQSADHDIPPAVLRFVWDSTFRNAFLDDLYELQSFLAVRNAADSTDAVSLSFMEVLHRMDPTQISAHLTHIQQILQNFVGEKTQRYLMLKTSEKYAERLLAEFQKKGRREDEWKKLAVQAEQERKSVQTELSQMAIKVGHLARRTKELKELVEKGISPLFNGRQINIMGKINTVVSTT